MSFGEIKLSKFDIKIIKALKKYHYINNFEFHGYFNFCGLEKVLEATYKLKETGLIAEDKNRKCFVLTPKCSDYLSYRKEKNCNKAFSIIGALAGIVAIISSIISVLKLLGIMQ